MTGTPRKPDDQPPERAVAILLLSIEPERAVEVLRRMQDDSLERVTRAMRELEELAVGMDHVDGVLEAALDRIRSGDTALGDVGGAVQGMLSQAFGPERGGQMAEQAAQAILARKPFVVFESLAPDDLAVLLAEEHPQIAAVFLAHLDRGKAGRVLKHVRDERRGDLIRRVATLDRAPPELVQRVLDVMRRKVRELGFTGARAEPRAWVKAAAEILNHMGGGERRVLDAVAEENREVAAEIRDEMFTFDDLAKLDRRSMQKVLSQIESRTLALALKAVPDEVEANVFANLSRRAGDMVCEERDTLGPTPLSEVLEAQQLILELVRSLMDSGDLSVTEAETLV